MKRHEREAGWAEKKHTVMNRYAEQAFEPPIKDPRIRAWLQQAAWRTRNKVDGAELFGLAMHGAWQHVLGIDAGKAAQLVGGA